MTKLKNFAPVVSRYLNPVDFLEALYRATKTEKGTYSYVEFAEDLGFSRSNVVHLMIRGKRPITSKTGETISETLGFKGLERRYWLNLVAFHHEVDEVERERLMTEIVEIKSRIVEDIPSLQNQFEFFKEWFHSIIYELASLENFPSDPKDIAAQLEPRIRPEQAKRSVALLEELGLLVRKEDKLVPVATQLSTGDEIASLAVVRYHQNMIDLGRRALTAFESDVRDVTSITFSANDAFLNDVKKELSLFRKKILAMAESVDEKDRVYQLNLQLFPMSKKKDD